MSSRHLKLVQYMPPGAQPHVCAALWREGDHVHLASPLLGVRHGVRDPRAYVRQFPDALASIDAFEDAMTWLDAACYAAIDPREVEVACRQHPEWQLQCSRYDGSDAALLGLAELIRAAERVGRLPEPIMRECLLELIKQILKNDPELVDAQIEAIFHEGSDVATVELGLDRSVLLSVLGDVPSTEVARVANGLHDRLTDEHKAWTQGLLVLPELESETPVFMTPRVVVTDMDPDHLRAALVRMAKR